MASCSLDTASSPKARPSPPSPPPSPHRLKVLLYFFISRLLFLQQGTQKNPELYYLNYIALLTVECLYMKIYIY